MGTNASAGSGDDGAWQWLIRTLDGRPVPSLVVVIGLGNGALLRALDARAPGRTVVAFEPDPATAAAFLAEDWTSWRASGRLTYLAAPDYAGESEAWRAFPDDPEDHVLLVAPHIGRVVTPEAVAAAHALKRILYGARANAEARRRFAPRYLVNAIRNLPSIASGRSLADIEGAYLGRPAIIAAAGPSLESALPELRSRLDGAVLISVDTALRVLLDADIAPHFVVGLDPGSANARHFRALPPAADTWLISEIALDPLARTHFAGRTLWFRVSDHDPWPWFHSLGLDVQQLDVWGSVVTAAFQVAVLAGCDPIVFTGADLSYAGRQPYSRGTTYEFQWARWAATGTLVEDAWLVWQAGATREVPDLAGRSRPTTPALLAFRDWLVSRAAASGRRVVNATGAGLLMGNGIEQVVLDDVSMADTPVPRVSEILAGPRPHDDPSTMRAHVVAAHAAIAGGHDTDVLASWRRFTGHAWDPSEVSGALAAALQEFTREPGTPPGGAITLGLPRGILPRLPECMHRWYRWLHEQDPGEARLSRPERDACIAQAFRLLLTLCAMLKDPEVSASVRRPMAGGDAVPLSAAYDWSEPLAWLVYALEALLGAACVTPATSEWSDFFGRRADVRAEDVDVHRNPQPAGAGTLHEAVGLLALRLCAADGHACIDPRSLVVHGGGAGAPDASAESTHAVSVRLEDVAGSVLHELPLHVHSGSLARIHTGLICAAVGAGDLAPSMIADCPSAVELRHVDGVGRIAATGLRTVADARALLRPRVLALAPERRAYVAYATDTGVVCVIPGASESVMLRPGGGLEPHVKWPRPIVGEMRMGNELLAWSNGTSAWTDPLRGYVMWRNVGGSDVRVSDLPCRPSSGVPWNDRVYWTCVEPGLYSWAPNDEPHELPGDSAFLSLVSRGDHLAAIPLQRAPDGRIERRLTGHEVLLYGDGRRVEKPLGPLGPCSSTATGRHGWTAEAYPHADTVMLRHAARSPVRLVCYYPVRLAWLDDALAVSTLQGDLLLFEGLAATVEHLSTPP